MKTTVNFDRLLTAIITIVQSASPSELREKDIEEVTSVYEEFLSDYLVEDAGVDQLVDVKDLVNQILTQLDF